MKKLLILIVVIALFLHFYPQPKLESWYNEQKNSALETFSDATDTKVRIKIDVIITDLKPHLGSFNSKELNYLNEITKSRHTVKAFYTTTCIEKKRYKKLQVMNKNKICKVISKYASLL